MWGFLAFVFAFDDRQARHLAAAFGAHVRISEFGGGFIAAAVGAGARAVRVERIYFYRTRIWKNCCALVVITGTLKLKLLSGAKTPVATGVHPARGAAASVEATTE